MTFDYYCAACGNKFGRFKYMVSPCKKCGCTEKASNANIGIKMPVESSERYQKWFHSDKTQARLRLPDSHPDKLEPLSKSSDAAHY